MRPSREMVASAFRGAMRQVEASGVLTADIIEHEPATPQVPAASEAQKPVVVTCAAHPRTDQWREHLAPASVNRWGVYRATTAPGPGVEWDLTRTGRVRSFARRAHAYMRAEVLNEREFRRAAEERSALGIEG